MNKSILSLGSDKHQRRILFHIFHSDFPKETVMKLEPQHFTEEKHKILFALIKQYLVDYNSLPSEKNIAEILKSNKNYTDEQKESWVHELSIIFKDYKNNK